MSSIDEIYRRLKGIESLVPVPPPGVMIIDVGLYDEADNRFFGLRSVQDGVTAERQPGSSRPVFRPNMVPPRIATRFKQVLLRFRARNSPYVVHVDNVAHECKTWVLVVVDLELAWARDSSSSSITVQWRIGSDGAPGTINEQLVFDLQAPLIDGGVPSYLGTAGAFTIPILPVSVVYAPYQSPRQSAAMNTTTYGTQHTFGSSLSVSGRDSSARTTFQTIANAGATIGAIAGAYSALGGGGIVGQALSGLRALAEGLGRVDGSVAEHVVNEGGHTVRLVSSSGETVQPSSGLGPGDGDILRFFRSVRLMWAFRNGEVVLTILDNQGLMSWTAHRVKAVIAELKADRNADPLLLRGYENLLSMDPLAFVRPTLVRQPLRAPRFQPADPHVHGLNGVRLGQFRSTARESSSFRGQTQSRVAIENHHPGWLSFLGLGETENVSTTLSTTHTSLKAQEATSVTYADFTLHAAVDEAYEVSVYFDTVFNTFVVLGPVAAPPIHGDAD